MKELSFKDPEWVYDDDYGAACRHYGITMTVDPYGKDWIISRTDRHGAYLRGPREDIHSLDSALERAQKDFEDDVRARYESAQRTVADIERIYTDG